MIFVKFVVIKLLFDVIIDDDDDDFDDVNIINVVYFIKCCIFYKILLLYMYLNFYGKFE